MKTLPVTANHNRQCRIFHCLIVLHYRLLFSAMAHMDMEEAVVAERQPEDSYIPVPHEHTGAVAVDTHMVADNDSLQEIPGIV